MRNSLAPDPDPQMQTLTVTSRRAQGVHRLWRLCYAERDIFPIIKVMIQIIIGLRIESVSVGRAYSTSVVLYVVDISSTMCVAHVT